MTIYEITYECDGAKAGFACEYFTSKVEMRARIAQLKREHKQEIVDADALVEAGGIDAVYPGYPMYKVNNITINKIVFTGTCMEMVLRALRYNA